MASLSLEDELREKIYHHLNQIYVNNDNYALSEKIIAVFFQGRDLISPNPNISKWDSSDIILITYAHSIVENEKAPLQTLLKFLDKHIQPYINTVHILPYFPYS